MPRWQPIRVEPAERPDEHGHPWRRRALLAAVGGALLSGVVYVAVAGVRGLLTAPRRGTGNGALSPDRQARDFYLTGLYQTSICARKPASIGPCSFSRQRSRRIPTSQPHSRGWPRPTICSAEYTLMPAKDAYPLAKAAAERALKLRPAPCRRPCGARLHAVLLGPRFRPVARLVRDCAGDRSGFGREQRTGMR